MFRDLTALIGAQLDALVEAWSGAETSADRREAELDIRDFFAEVMDGETQTETDNWAVTVDAGGLKIVAV